MLLSSNEMDFSMKHLPALDKPNQYSTDQIKVWTLVSNFKKNDSDQEGNKSRRAHKIYLFLSSQLRGMFWSAEQWPYQ